MKKIILSILCYFFINSICFSEIYNYETKIKIKPYCKDFFRGKAQITFRKNYKKLVKEQTQESRLRLENIHKYRQLEMENAFKHAFVSAKMTYIFGEKNTLKAAYTKELKTYDTEIKNFGGKTPAFLDTNCDLWNDKAGINYALNGKKERKSFKKVGNEIFNNIALPNSDFIIDYKNDKRRWDKNATPDNILDILKEKKYGLKQDK